MVVYITVCVLVLIMVDRVAEGENVQGERRSNAQAAWSSETACSSGQRTQVYGNVF